MRVGDLPHPTVKRPGMTIIELVVVLALLVLVFGMTAVLFSQGQVAWLNQSAKLTLQHEARQAVQLMARELRQTALGWVAIGGGGRSIQFRLPTDLDGDGDVINAAGAVEWGAPITYAVEPSLQLVKRQGAARTVLANGVNTVDFRQDPIDPQRLIVRVVLERRTLVGHALQADSSTEIRLRN